MENEFKNKVFSWTNIVDIKEAKRWAYDQSCKAEREARGYEAKILARLYLLATEFTEAFDRPELDQEPLDADWQAAKLSMDQPPLKPDAAEALGAFEWLLEYHEEARPYRVKHNQKYADLRRLVRTALQNQGAQWMPIETAPKDADNFLIANFANKPSFISFAWWPYDAKNKNYKWLDYTGGNTVGVHNLTHWMSLPAAPTPNRTEG